MPTDSISDDRNEPLAAASRMTLAPTKMTANADDYGRTLKDVLRRLRAQTVQIDAEPREPKLMRTFADYVRTSIVGLRPRGVGTV